jgi:hypothetical protein
LRAKAPQRYLFSLKMVTNMFNPLPSILGSTVSTVTQTVMTTTSSVLKDVGEFSGKSAVAFIGGTSPIPSKGDIAENQALKTVNQEFKAMLSAVLDLLKSASKGEDTQTSDRASSGGGKLEQLLEKLMKMLEDGGVGETSRHGKGEARDSGSTAEANAGLREENQQMGELIGMLLKLLKSMEKDEEDQSSDQDQGVPGGNGQNGLLGILKQIKDILEPPQPQPDIASMVLGMLSAMMGGGKPA